MSDPLDFTGKRVAVMDLITALFTIWDDDGTARASCRMVFVFPRQMA